MRHGFSRNNVYDASVFVSKLTEKRHFRLDLMLLVRGAEPNSVRRNRVLMQEMRAVPVFGICAVARNYAVAWNIEGEDSLGCAWVLDRQILEIAASPACSRWPAKFPATPSPIAAFHFMTVTGPSLMQESKESCNARVNRAAGV